MSTLVERKGYASDETRSLIGWMLRSNGVIENEETRYYFYDVSSPLLMKTPEVILKSLYTDHPIAPNSVIKRAVKFSEERMFCRDRYEAVQLMDDISRLPVDRNLVRAQESAFRDEAMRMMKPRGDWEDKMDGQEEDEDEWKANLGEFARILKSCDGTDECVSENKLREMALYALRIHQWSRKHNISFEESPDDVKDRLTKTTGLSSLSGNCAMLPLWLEMFDYLERSGSSDSVRVRLTLIFRGWTCFVYKWHDTDLMMVLWGLYSLMRMEPAPEPDGMRFEETVSMILKSRTIEKRLTIPSFAVDVTTVRGRNCVDTTEKLVTKKLIEQLGSKEEVLRMYDPIEASHGPSPHKSKQTRDDFNRMIEECEWRSGSASVPRLFESKKMTDMDEESDEEEDERDEKLLRRLQNKDWQVVLQVAMPEPLDENLIGMLPKTAKHSTFLDFEANVSYKGPLQPGEALRALAISRLGTVLCNLQTVQKVQLRLNAAKNRIYLEQTLIGERPIVTENTQEGSQ